MKRWRVLLVPLSLLWYIIAVIRNKLFDWGWLPSRSFNVPIICVGNLAVGGTGKTPHVEYILRLLHDAGYRVAMLSRGYGRQTHGYILANATHQAADIGDEPYQVLCNCPFATVAVCEKRVYGIERLLKLPNPPQVIVLDDAFQHRYVKTDMNIILTDAHKLFTNDRIIPWGSLREPSSALQRAQMVIITKCEADNRPSITLSQNQSLFYSRIVYLEENFSSLQKGKCPSPLSTGTIPVIQNKEIFLICSIANPYPLRNYLLQKGASDVRLVAFRDHHTFTKKDAVYINKEWRKMKTKTFAITTQKDATRLATILSQLDKSLQDALYIQSITVEIESADEKSKNFNQTILSYVRNYPTNRCMD